MAQLEVQIGADVKGLLSALESTKNKINDTNAQLTKLVTNNERVNNSISRLSNEYKSGAISEERYSVNLSRLQNLQQKYAKEIPSLEKDLSRLNKTYRQLGGTSSSGVNAVSKLGKSTANAVPAVTEFSRVIQDAPYGIQGVANNIQQLTGQFGYLSKATGGTIPALKAMLGALAGPTGILLAVSAVTSILVKYGDEIGNLIKGNNALEASQKEVNEALNDFYGNQVSKINTYISILDDANTSETERKEITKELIKLVPSLKEADFNYGNNLDLVREKVGKYVLAQASRIEADTLVKENSKKLAKQNTLTSLAYDGIIKKTQKGQLTFLRVDKDEANRLRSYLKSIGVVTTHFLSGIKTEVSDVDLVEIARKEIEEVSKELEPIQQRISELYGDAFSGGKGEDGGAFEELKKKQTDLKKQLEDSILIKGVDAKETIALKEAYRQLSVQIDKVNSFFEAGKNQGKAKKDFEKQRLLLIELAKASDNEILLSAEKTFKEVNDIYKNSGAELKSSLELKEDFINTEKVFKNITDIDVKIKQLISTFKELNLTEVDFRGLNLEQLTAFEQKIKSSQETISIFANAAGASFNALANQIAQNLETGNAILDAFVGSLIQSLAQIVAAGFQSLITEKIIGAGKTEINREISSGNAITVATSAAAALGPAGVVALPGLIASQLALVNGAFVTAQAFAKGGFAGDNNMAFLNRNELVLRPMEQAALYNAIRGHNLSGLQGNNYNNSNTNEIMGKVVLRGQNQYIQLKRAEKQMRRKFNA